MLAECVRWDSELNTDEDLALEGSCRFPAHLPRQEDQPREALQFLNQCFTVLPNRAVLSQQDIEAVEVKRRLPQHGFTGNQPGHHLDGEVSLQQTGSVDHQQRYAEFATESLSGGPFPRSQRHLAGRR